MRMNPVPMPPLPGAPLLWAMALGLALFIYTFAALFMPTARPLGLTAGMGVAAIAGGFFIALKLHGYLVLAYYQKRAENTDRAAVNNDSTPPDELARILERRKHLEEFRFAILSHPRYKREN